MEYFLEIVYFIAAHWLAFSVTAAIIAVFAGIELYWIRKNRPTDTIGNGITVGSAKAFDNRSLALRVERLNASLESLKVVNQSFTESLSAFQAQTSSESTGSLVLGMKGALAEKSGKETGGGDEKRAASEATNFDNKLNIGLAASDILNDQLNLASQIFNLQLLLERSLTDRMIEKGSRLQTVLGFQVSITPPRGYEDCVAVVEVAARMKSSSAPVPVSLVALMPQEKTYNAAALSSSERSIAGSAVARVLTVGFSDKRGRRQLFIHRDSDTIAFERDPRVLPTLLSDAAVFGWEFRPVLGRHAVSAGTRQMLAVIAVPVEDKKDAPKSVLEVKTRSYWRRYKCKWQTSAPNLSWLPWRVDRSANIESVTQQVETPNTAAIHEALAPKVTHIEWVNSGQGKATVIVQGRNFFSGTKVVIGGSVHREEDGTLTLKSDQALEFETTIDSLATGDAVLSGRFGQSSQLTVPREELPFDRLYISRATIRPLPKSKAFRVSLDIIGKDFNGQDKNLTDADLEKLPEPILFIGTEAVAMPYDYEDKDLSAGPNMPLTTATKCLGVKASISSKTLGKSPSMSFRVPFCGFNYQASQPMSFSEPTVVRMGTNLYTSFCIFYPQGFGGTTPGSSTTPNSSLSIDLDQTYSEANGTLERINETECRLTVLTDVLSRHQNMVVRIGSAKPYLVPMPPDDKPSPKPSQPLSFSEPTVVRTGNNLYTVFRIFYPQGFGGNPPSSISLSIDLDRTYIGSPTPPLEKMSDTEYRFTVETDVISRYQNMVVRIGSAEPYLLPIPPEDKPSPKARTDPGAKPPQVVKSSHGPVEWEGSALDTITDVTVTQTSIQEGKPQSMTAIPQHFTTYASGTRLLVYLTPGTTDLEGKLILECTTSSGDKLNLPVFVTAP